jgi:1A family penicillin-binding protein
MRRHKILILLLAGVFLLMGFAYWYLLSDLPTSDSLITRASPDTTKIYDRNGRLLYEVLDPRAGRRTRVSLRDLPSYLRHAVIAVEDASYYENPGLDLAGIARSLFQNISAGEIVAGGSTITQQLAREVLLSKEERESRSLTRKLREAVLALQMTRSYSKDQILEMYLNEAYFGQLAYGVEAAARVYFGKSARDLDLAESALLAGLIQSPATYDPLVNYDAARSRQGIVLALMVKKGFINFADAQLAQAESLHFASTTPQTTLRAPHFVSYVRSLLEEEYGAERVNRGGLQVVTTLDLDLQERAQTIVQRQLRELTRRSREEGAPDYNVHDAALVALDPATGQILAMVGSADYFDESIDGAVNVVMANRQPGSAIKPITYATAFARDYTPATVLSDVPTTFLTKEEQPYEPQNYDRVWHGPISLRQALATSSNMVAVKVLDHVGLEAMLETAKSLGISTFNDSDRFGLALTLGGGEVKLLELTAAYAAFADQGAPVHPVAILSVQDTTKDGLAMTESPYSSSLRDERSLVSPQVAYLITSILSDDAARIPAFGEDSMLRLSRPAAAKTGTTTDFRDNWALGYTPDLAVGVWVGNADNTPMYKITGITGAGPIWHDFMDEALKAVLAREFKRPPGLFDLEICETSGLVATPICPHVRKEIFISGTEPTRPDDSYRALPLDAATGLLWTDGCRGARVERVYRILPPDAQEWGRKLGITSAPEINCLGETLTRGVEGEGMTSQLRRVDAFSGLVITSPSPNSTFSVSPQLPIELQQIEVEARLNALVSLHQVMILIDAQPIAAFTRAPYKTFWRLAPGEHTMQAFGIDVEGTRVESKAIRFRVEPD